VFRCLIGFLCLGFISMGTVTHGEKAVNRVNVTATDFRFAPQQWHVDAQKEISLSMTNKGIQDHEWVILKSGTNVTLPFNEDDEEKVYWEIETGPAATIHAMFVSPTQPGTYTIVCGKPRHIERGMTATLVVE